MLLRVATSAPPPGAGSRGVGISTPSGGGHGASSTPEEEVVPDPSRHGAAVDFGDDASAARVVLWGMVRASSQQGHQPPGCGAEEQTARAWATNGDGGGGGGRGDKEKGSATWPFLEGVLLVCEGVLKHLVETRMAEVASGGAGEMCSTAARGAHSGSADEGCGGEWPAELLRSTPSLGELLVPLLSQAEHALCEAELMLSMASHHLQQQQQQPRDGSLELWRAGSQLLPTIARAMVWWNPRAILR